jgi:hypothetical protein
MTSGKDCGFVLTGVHLRKERGGTEEKARVRKRRIRLEEREHAKERECREERVVPAPNRTDKQWVSDPFHCWNCLARGREEKQARTGT